MSYKVGRPPSIEATATRMYIASNRNNVHYVTCSGVTCEECFRRGLHRVCPVCGASLAFAGVAYVCKCGTMLYVCTRANGPAAVTRFVPNYRMFADSSDKDDVI